MRSTSSPTSRRPAVSTTWMGPGALEKLELFFGKIERGLDEQAQLDEFFCKRRDLFRERAAERTRRRARRRFGARLDQVGDGFGLSQVELVVEKGTLGEFAGLGEPQPRQPRLPAGWVKLRRG